MSAITTRRARPSGAAATPAPPATRRTGHLRRFAARAGAGLTALVVIGTIVMPAREATATTTSAGAVRTDDSARIDTWIEGRMAAHGIPGAAVAVVRGGEIVHMAGYGTADETGRTVTPETPFIIGSASKPFTAAVVGQLVEEGLLSWDEPVWPYLADVIDEAPAGFEAATVEQLVNHTGGLSMSVGVAGAVRIHDGPDALDRRAAELLSRRLRSAPGERWEYSNAGPTLLAAVVERVTGQRFADELRDRVFDPLGMTGSFATEADPRAASLATGHELWFGRWRPAALRYDPAGVAMGYIGSTAHDLAAFMQAHLDGDPAVPATATQIASGTVVPTGWDTPLDAGYGRGWFVDELAGHQVVSHPGSLGHFTAHVLLVPGAEDLGVAVLSNASAFIAAGHEGQYDLGLGVTRLLLGEDPQPTDRGPLLTLLVPAIAWGAVALLLAAIARYLVRLARPRPRRRTGARGRRRQLLPGAAFLVVGAGLLAAPLGTARHFYPDAGWALTLVAHIAVVWGVVRLGLAAGALRSARAVGRDEAPSSPRPPLSRPGPDGRVLARPGSSR